MTTLNKKLFNESTNPFHAYLLISNSSIELINQAKKFSSLISFGTEEIVNHPDIKFVSSENINTLGVEDIRDVVSKEKLSPIEGKYKVIVFPPFKSLTEEASNALLKTIEEPSESSIFMILSSGIFWSHGRDDSKSLILSTIKSRCRTIFLESNLATNFDFSLNDFIKFLDYGISFNSEVNSELESLVQFMDNLTDIENSGPERLKILQSILNSVSSVNSEIKEITNTSVSELLIKCIEYVANAVLNNFELDSKRYQFVESLELAISDLSSGLRPQIVISFLSVKQY